MPIQRIQFTEWLPDQPAIGKGLQDAVNVVPVSSGYAPFPTTTVLSGAASENLDNVFVGKVGDTVNVMAGGDTKLFKLNATTNALDDVSKLYSTTSSAYNGNSRWKFVQYGSSVIGCNYASPLQRWTVGSSTNFESLGQYVSGTYSRGASGYTAVTTTTAHGLTLGTTTTYTSEFTSGAATSGDFAISNAVITTVARTTNVVTITTSAVHGYAVGHTVTVAATTNTSLNGTFTIATVPTTTTFTYAQTASNITSVADTGSVYNTKAFMINNSGSATSGNVKTYTSIAPKSKYLAVVRDFVVAANLVDSPTKLQWCDINDETNWNSGNASQSDFQIIADGGTIQGITGGEFGIILLEKAIYRMQYVGSPYFFQFDAISRNIGCPEGNSVINSNGITYFLSDDGFYLCDGRTVVPIGAEKIDKYFYANFDVTKSDTMSAAVDPARKIIVWNYPTVSGGRELLVYHWQLQKWTRAETTVNYLAQNSVAASSGTTLEGLDSAYIINATSLTATQNGKTYTVTDLGTTTTAQWTAIGVSGTAVVGTKFTKSGATGVGTGTVVDLTASAAALKTMDTMSTSLDSRIYSSGKFVFAGASTTYIVTFTGTSATANLVMSDVEEGYNSVATLVRPLIDDGSADVAIASRRTLSDNIQFTTPASSGEGNRIPLRSAGRFHRLSVTPTGNWTTAVAIDLTLEPQGGR
jgi:hypothetical protein